MADLTRAYDWSPPGGPIDQWPEALLITFNTNVLVPRLALSMLREVDMERFRVRGRMGETRQNISALWTVFALILTVCLTPIFSTAQSAQDDPEARPPVTKADIEIVKRAREILSSPAKWNRNDTRVCPKDASIFSLYCALEKATIEVNGNFEHRGAAMQEARFVIDAIAPNANYEHRLMGYNNDPKTTFADIQKVFDLLEQRITKRLAEQPNK